MANFKILLKKNFLELKRTKKWFIFIGVFAFLSIVSALFAKYLLALITPVFEMMGLVIEFEPTIADSYAQFTANMGETAYLLIVIMFSALLIKEKTAGTYYILKNNGVKESEIVLAEYLTKLILITVSYLASILVFVICNLILFNSYTGYRGVISLIFIYLLLVFALTFAFFVSSVVKKKSIGYVLGIVSYFVLPILSTIPKINVATPFYTLTLANNVMVDLEHVWADYLINGFATIALIVTMVFASIYFFKERVDN